MAALLSLILLLFVPWITAVVHDLTPALAEELRQQKKRRYFVKMDAGPCDYQNPNDICRILDQTLWQPLSQAFPAEYWTRLDCGRTLDLCHELSTAERVASIEGHRKVDFMTVGDRPTSPTFRVVELYRASQASPSELARYLQQMIVQDLPFEAANEMGLMQAPKRKVSLAVLVLTTRGFVRPDVWQAFLESSPPGETRIFMHNVASNPNQISRQQQEQDDIIHVPSVFSHRGTIALVRPVIQLLRYAMAYGGASHFVLVSGDSVPLVSAADMIQQLTHDNNQTRFERHAQDQFKVNPELRRAYPGPFRKSKNWVLWNDEAARFFAERAHDETHNWEIVSMADEYYWINVAQEHGIPWVDLPVMYDEWPAVQAERPNLLKRVNAAALRQKHGHLFARKITNETILELDWMAETRNVSVENEL